MEQQTYRDGYEAGQKAALAGIENPEAVRSALERSVALQSHYAKLLNAHDGGQRMTFDSAQEWIARLHALEKFDDKGATIT